METLTTDERKAIIHRVWTLEEAREASRHINVLNLKGYWNVTDLPQCLVEFAQAVGSAPAACISQARAKIIEAYEAHIGFEKGPVD